MGAPQGTSEAGAPQGTSEAGAPGAAGGLLSPSAVVPEGFSLWGGEGLRPVLVLIDLGLLDVIVQVG